MPDNIGAALRELAPRVLAADDTEISRVLLRRMLENLGCRVTSVDSGERALALLTREHEFDLLVMDWHMPVMDGLEAATRIRQWERAQARPRIPIVAFTASSFDGDAERCKQAGMDQVLHKPLVKTQLEAVLWQCLAGPLAAVQPPMPGPEPAAAGAPSARAAAEPCLDPELLDELRALDGVESGLLHKLVTSFLDRAPGLVQTLAEAVAQADGERITRLAHEFRGSAASMGAKHLAAALAGLELQPRAPAPDLCRAIAQIERECESAAVELRALLLRHASAAQRVPSPPAT